MPSVRQHWLHLRAMHPRLNESSGGDPSFGTLCDHPAAPCPGERSGGVPKRPTDRRAPTARSAYVRADPVRAPAAIAALLLVLAWTDAAAQIDSRIVDSCRCRFAPAELDLGLDARYTAINAAIGAATAGISDMLRGRRPSLYSIVTGAAGGAVTYGGKRVAAVPGTGRLFVGRQIAAVGGSLVRNAATGQPAFSELTFPAGPFRLLVAPGDSVRVRLNLASVVTAVYFMVDAEGADLDLGRTFSTGTIVMAGRDERLTGAGRHMAGVVRIAKVPPPFGEDYVLRHEMTHVIQSDQLYFNVGDAVERRIRTSHGWLGRVGRHVDFGFEALVLLLGNAFVPYRDRPWEIEARRITGDWVSDGSGPGPSIRPALSRAPRVPSNIASAAAPSAAWFHPAP